MEFSVSKKRLFIWLLPCCQQAVGYDLAIESAQQIEVRKSGIRYLRWEKNEMLKKNSEPDGIQCTVFWTRRHSMCLIKNWFFIRKSWKSSVSKMHVQLYIVQCSYRLCFSPKNPTISSYKLNIAYSESNRIDCLLTSFINGRVQRTFIYPPKYIGSWATRSTSGSNFCISIGNSFHLHLPIAKWISSNLVVVSSPKMHSTKI